MIDLIPDSLLVATSEHRKVIPIMNKKEKCKHEDLGMFGDKAKCLDCGKLIGDVLDEEI